MRLLLLASAQPGQALSAPVNVAVPFITSSFTGPLTVVAEGDMLFGWQGTWEGNPDPTFPTMEWQSSPDLVTWTTVDASSSTYTPTSGDVGKYLWIVVTATNSQGTTTANSNPVGLVVGVTPPVPVTPPTIT